jgi:ATP-dependent helicase/nuclease subunit A
VTEDASKIVTCHSSKGLEYPVVFLVDAGAAFSSQELRQRLVYSADFGLSFRLRTPSGLALVNNPVHDLVCHNVKRKNYEENLRVLYVALTRARERLYIVGVCPTTRREEYDLRVELLREYLSPYALRGLRSYLEIMLVTGGGFLLSSPSEFLGEELCATTVEPDGESAGAAEGDFILPDALLLEADSDEVARGYTERFTYRYPNEYLTTLPEKLSVSGTSPEVLDGADESTLACVSMDGKLPLDFEKTLHAPVLNGGFDLDDGENTPSDEKIHLPKFMTGSSADESAKRGIATHYFLQFCDLDHLTERGSRAELDRLLARGFLTSVDGERVRIREIDLFTKSELFRDMRDAIKLYRELRFNVPLPAELFTQNEERREALRGREVLVQGVIDCIVVYPDGSIGLFDYKTDRLTREELADYSLAAEKLRDKHSLQLYYYSLAVRRIFGRAPSRVEVYSLPLGRTVPVLDENMLPYDSRVTHADAR